jgi:hypothetical protein
MAELRDFDGITQASIEQLAKEWSAIFEANGCNYVATVRDLLERGLIRPGAGKLRGEPVELIPVPVELVEGAEQGKWKIVVGWAEPGVIGVEVDPGLVDACSILEDGIDAFFATHPGEGDPLEGAKILRDAVAKAAEAKRS